MRGLHLLRHPSCLVLGHAYPLAARVTEDGLRYWTCRRCRRRRYKPPPDFLDGAGSIASGDV